MPPTSRGHLYFAFLRRYATRSGEPTKIRSAKLPTAARNPSPILPRRKTVTPPEKSGSNAQRPRQNQFHIDESEAPSEAHIPFTSPASATPMLERLVARFNPRIRSLIRSMFRLIPWIPPLLLLQIHLPYQIMWVNGPSMSPFLNTNYSDDDINTQDCVLVDRYREFKTPTRGFENTGTQRLERGMIIVFHTPHDPNKIAVKRIVGLPGDRVQPLVGYFNSTEIPAEVVVPWNHIWVEGDVDDRTRSVDSNWYGPISKCLIIGQVKSVLTPWYSPTAVRWQDHSYPAQKRVEENAVRTLDPDLTGVLNGFRDGKAEMFLLTLQRNPELALANARTQRGKTELRDMQRKCWQAQDAGDAELAKLANRLEVAIEALLNQSTDQAVAKRDLESLVTA